ncbi:protein kinase [Streptomyces sp. NPDC029216]|uniref:protein kinase domain-containing protein n=1 Tax=Streptomyces sp. NPDC029216 TaxID=3154701 RepID=UPI0033D862F5
MSGGFGVRVGELLADRYRLDRRLGAGGMGEVWAGHDLALDRPVAVKVLLEAATDEELIARFRREATIGARLQHPGITVVHDVGQHEGRLFIVMELLPGEDLGAVLARERRGLPAAEAVSLAAQTAEALAAAHERAVVHRDLKPQNLFLLPGGRLKICDFGIAHSADATAGWTVTGRMFGTPPYMAPEQWRGEHVDARCDLYALGCVLYALLSGEPPFGQTEGPYVLMRRHIEDPPPPLREAGVVVTPELETLLTALLAKAPADRPQSAERVGTALRALAGPLRGAGGSGTGASAEAGVGGGGPAGENGAGRPAGAGGGREPGGRDGGRETGGPDGGLEPGGPDGGLEPGGPDGGLEGGGGGFGVGESLLGFVRELLVEAEETLAALPAGAGDVRIEGLALAAEAAARFDAGLAGRLLADAERWAWADGGGDGARVAGLLTGLARRISRDAPARTERVLTDAQQALFTVFGPTRASRLRKVAEELAAVAPERGVRLARRYFPGSAAEEAVLARAALASAPTDLARAERWLARIPSAAVRTATESKAVSAVARQDLPAALRLAARIPVGGARVRALCRVAGERVAVGDRDGAAEALDRAEQALAELVAGRSAEQVEKAARDSAEGHAAHAEHRRLWAARVRRGDGHDTGDPEVDAARAALEAARDLNAAGHRSVLDVATARERATAARELAEPAERGRELAWIARDCTAGAPWLARAAADPGTHPPHSVTAAPGRGTALPARPGPSRTERWYAETSLPDALYAAGQRVVWTANSEVGCLEADSGTTRWTAYADEGVAARPLPEPERVWCAADADTVCVVVESDAGPPGRLVVREPADGRVRWWRELPEAASMKPAPGLVLLAADGELSALRKDTGEPVWRQPVPETNPRSVTVSGECLVLGDGRQLRALHLPTGAPLWSWPRGYGAGAREVPDLPAGTVHVLDGGVVRALDRRRGYELWRFEPGVAAERLLVEDGVVYVAAYRPDQGWDTVFALDGGSGTVRWQQPVTRREGTECVLELLGVRRGVLYVRSAHGGRRGLLGRGSLPFVTGLEVGTGRSRRLLEHEAAAGPSLTLAGDTLVLATPRVTGVGLLG